MKQTRWLSEFSCLSEYTDFTLIYALIYFSYVGMIYTMESRKLSSVTQSRLIKDLVGQLLCSH